MDEKNVNSLILDLKDVEGCLSLIKTKDDEARRRYIDPVKDDDYYSLHFGRPYFNDSIMKLSISKATRRLARTTQVMTKVLNAHIRNRLTHTGEVIQIAWLGARMLGLNEDLCHAIALGHDIGHTPFGHLGEMFIDDIAADGFNHATFGVIIAQQIERKGSGLNLTWQVLNGILNHSRGKGDMIVRRNISEEATMVMYADKIAYVFADINDIFQKAKLLNIEDFSELNKLVNLCGNYQRERVAYCIRGLCLESKEHEEVTFSDCEEAQVFSQMKKLMYEVYDQVNYKSANQDLENAYRYIRSHPYQQIVNPLVILALMTDEDVLYLNSKEHLTNEDMDRCSVAEIIPFLKNKEINISDPDLDW